MSRNFDIIIYGATGYTAGLTIDYLLTSKTGSAYKWAIAGRNKGRLEAVLAEKAKQFGAKSAVDIAAIPIILATTDDEKSLDAMCQQTKVLLAMAGPYALCGLPVVGACVRNGTHYMDITGEFNFIRKAIELYHEEARRKKVNIVNTCGFDCVPSDIGALMMIDHVAKQQGDDEVKEIAAYFDLKGASQASGGTAHSIVNLFKTMTAADMSPVCLNPPANKAAVPTPSQKFIGYSSLLRQYTAPFIMAGGNERTVRRSNALLGRPNVSYWECVTSPSLVGAVASLFTIVALGAVMLVPPLRGLAEKYLLPKQGDGPSESSKTGASYKVTFVASTNRGKQYKGTFFDERNPYDSTAVFVAESAACMLDMLADKESSSLIKGGVMPPAAAFGSRYLERLKAHDCRITTSIEEITKSK